VSGRDRELWAAPVRIAGRYACENVGIERATRTEDDDARWKKWPHQASSSEAAGRNFRSKKAVWYRGDASGGSGEKVLRWWMRQHEAAQDSTWPGGRGEERDRGSWLMLTQQKDNGMNSEIAWKVFSQQQRERERESA
jgi:hypothetical protein